MDLSRWICVETTIKEVMSQTNVLKETRERRFVLIDERRNP